MGVLSWEGNIEALASLRSWDLRCLRGGRRNRRHQILQSSKNFPHSTVLKRTRRLPNEHQHKVSKENPPKENVASGDRNQYLQILDQSWLQSLLLGLVLDFKQRSYRRSGTNLRRLYLAVSLLEETHNLRDRKPDYREDDKDEAGGSGGRV